MAPKLSSRNSGRAARSPCSSAPADSSVKSSGWVFISYRNRHSAAPSCRCAARKPVCSPADFAAFRAAAGLRLSSHSVWARVSVMRLLAVAPSAITRVPAGRPASTAYMSP